MRNLSLFIAWRYIRSRSQERNISIMVKVCFLGIAIGSFALALVASVMSGFEQVTHEKMQGIHPQLMLRSGNQYLNTETFKKFFSQQSDIAAWSPTAQAQVMLQHDGTGTIDQIMVMNGIDPIAERQVTSLESKLIRSSLGKQLPDIIHDDYILIGIKAAQALDVHEGDSITMLFVPAGAEGKKITLDSHTAHVGGIFETGIEEYDANVIFASLPFVEALFPDNGINQINIKLRPDAHEQTVITQLRNDLNQFNIFSWKDLYPALVSALKLEKYVMFLILALITLVASMNIISLLFMQITQKRGDIAILQALGAPAHVIRNIFLFLGLSISLGATFIGLLFSIIASWMLEHYHFITLPDVYYATHLPSRMDYSLLIIVFCVVMVISFIAIWLPVRRIKYIKIADVLRFEA